MKKKVSQIKKKKDQKMSKKSQMSKNYIKVKRKWSKTNPYLILIVIMIISRKLEPDQSIDIRSGLEWWKNIGPIKKKNYLKCQTMTKKFIKKIQSVNKNNSLKIWADSEQGYQVPDMWK